MSDKDTVSLPPADVGDIITLCHRDENWGDVITITRGHCNQRAKVERIDTAGRMVARYIERGTSEPVTA